MARAGVEVQLYSFCNFGTGWWWVFEATPWLLYPREKDLIPTIEEAGWAARPV
jgi:hypothetical protein